MHIPGFLPGHYHRLKWALNIIINNNNNSSNKNSWDSDASGLIGPKFLVSFTSILASHHFFIAHVFLQKS
jgi:hypothetical protein